MKHFFYSKKAKRILINLFIGFHLTAFAFWASPFEFGLRNRLVQWITPYMLMTGLWQGWDMFAPDPLRINSHLEAWVTFQDGTHAVWTFPRMNQLSYFERYLKERYRKWSLSYVRLDSFSSTWADTARYVARYYYAPTNPPKEIKLTRFWMEIPPPDLLSNYQPRPKEYPHNQFYTFYTYLPRQEDFT